MRGNHFSFVVVAAILSGCAALTPPAPRVVNLQSKFNPQETAWFASSGTGSITGQAFFQTRGGQPRTCAGLEVSLLPHSVYGDERLTAIYGNATKGYASPDAARLQFAPDDFEYRQVRKTSICDAQGNFSFTALPPGDYVLTAAVIWTVPGPGYSPAQGGGLMQSVTLKPGENERVILTP